MGGSSKTSHRRNPASNFCNFRGAILEYPLVRRLSLCLCRTIIVRGQEDGLGKEKRRKKKEERRKKKEERKGHRVSYFQVFATVLTAPLTWAASTNTPRWSCWTTPTRLPHPWRQQFAECNQTTKQHGHVFGNPSMLLPNSLPNNLCNAMKSATRQFLKISVLVL